MITSKSSVHSVLFLVLSFVCSSILLFLIECEFVSFLFLIIYVGAIAIFFLFVVMMLDVKISEAPNDYIQFFVFGFIFTFFFILLIMLVSSDTFTLNSYIKNVIHMDINYYSNWYYKIDYLSEVKSLGQVIYTFYVLQFLIAGFILLLAVIGSTSLTSTGVYIGSKNQTPFKQISRNLKNAINVF
ncbi:MAG: NADH-quinone oxidoreductase subunit J [Pelagibacterales bacterium]|nr:NADH-quinone oxidoreductase subunit J [Pelagibacterales bacterium]